jgi:hypothetical protein
MFYRMLKKANAWPQMNADKRRLKRIGLSAFISVYLRPKMVLAASSASCQMVFAAGGRTSQSLHPAASPAPPGWIGQSGCLVAWLA